MEKLDLTKTDKTYFSAKTNPERVFIGKAQFLSLCGKGDPSGQPFAESIEAMYSTAYTLKFASKEKGRDFVVSKLEGLWWYDEKKYADKTMTEAVAIPRSEWEYRLLIRLPDFVTKEDINRAKETVIAKKGFKRVANLDFYSMTEGDCVQMLHVGPYSSEPESLKQIADYCETHALGRNGLHHEIYLSDHRKTAPEKLKTILREPVKPGK